MTRARANSTSNMSNAADQNWDYIIVGAGPAGCVLANRLSEKPSNKVLLLKPERTTRRASEPPEIMDIFAATAHSNPAFTWPGSSAAFGPRSDNAPDTRPRRRYTAGKVIGGSSSVNGMAANRGLPSDYDHWAGSWCRRLGLEGCSAVLSQAGIRSRIFRPPPWKGWPDQAAALCRESLAEIHDRGDGGG